MPDNVPMEDRVNARLDALRRSMLKLKKDVPAQMNSKKLVYWGAFMADVTRYLDNMVNAGKYEIDRVVITPSLSKDGWSMTVGYHEERKGE